MISLIITLMWNSMAEQQMMIYMILMIEIMETTTYNNSKESVNLILLMYQELYLEIEKLKMVIRGSIII